MSRIAVENFIEFAQDAGEELLYHTVRREMMAWHERFPKRRLQFYDQMGVVNIRVSKGDDWYSLYAPDHGERIDAVLSPLRELLDWYVDQAHQLNINVRAFALKEES